MPTYNQIHLDRALTDFSVAVGLQEQSAFVARRAFPPVNVAQQSNRYNIWTTASLTSSDAQKRAKNTPSAGRDFVLSRDTYFADVFAIHHDISEQDRANADEGWDLEQSVARLLVNDLLIAEEVAFAATAMVSGAWGTTVTGGTNFTVWSDPASTPIEDITTGVAAILSVTGAMPNKLVLGWRVYAALVNHPDIVDRIKYTRPSTLAENAGILGAVFGIDEVLIMRAVRNSAQDGLAASVNFVGGNDALLIVSPNGAGLQQASAGKTFVWTGLTGDQIRVKRYDIEEMDAYPRVEADSAFDHKIVASALGYFFDNAV